MKSDWIKASSMFENNLVDIQFLTSVSSLSRHKMRVVH